MTAASLLIECERLNTLMEHRRAVAVTRRDRIMLWLAARFITAGRWLAERVGRTKK